MPGKLYVWNHPIKSAINPLQNLHQWYNSAIVPPQNLGADFFPLCPTLGSIFCLFLFRIVLEVICFLSVFVQFFVQEFSIFFRAEMAM